MPLVPCPALQQDVNPFAMLLSKDDDDEEIPGDEDAMPGRGLLKHGSDASSLGEFFFKEL